MISAPLRQARTAPGLSLVAALALTAGAAARLAPYVPLAGTSGPRSGWTSWTTDPDQWVRLPIAALERSHVGGVYAGYWVAYTLTFEARGRVVAADPGLDRYPPYLVAAERSRHQAWVFPRPSTLSAFNRAVGAHTWLPFGSLTLADFESYLKGHGIAYRSESAGYFTIVYPAHGVALPSLAASASRLPVQGRRAFGLRIQSAIMPPRSTRRAGVRGGHPRTGFPARQLQLLTGLYRCGLAGFSVVARVLFSHQVQAGSLPCSPVRRQRSSAGHDPGTRQGICAAPRRSPCGPRSAADGCRRRNPWPCSRTRRPC